MIRTCWWRTPPCLWQVSHAWLVLPFADLKKLHGIQSHEPVAADKGISWWKRQSKFNQLMKTTDASDANDTILHSTAPPVKWVHWQRRMHATRAMNPDCFAKLQQPCFDCRDAAERHFWHLIDLMTWTCLFESTNIAHQEDAHQMPARRKWFASVAVSEQDSIPRWQPSERHTAIVAHCYLSTSMWQQTQPLRDCLGRG